MQVDTSVALMNSQNLKSFNVDKSANNDALLKEQTDKFEAFFIKQVLDISMQSDNKLYPKDAGDKIYKSMYNDTMSTALSGQFGFSEMIFNFLKEGR
jgi:Rod binding domain-containing protein